MQIHSEIIKIAFLCVYISKLSLCDACVRKPVSSVMLVTSHVAVFYGIIYCRRNPSLSNAAPIPPVGSPPRFGGVWTEEN